MVDSPDENVHSVDSLWLNAGTEGRVLLPNLAGETNPTVNDSKKTFTLLSRPNNRKRSVSATFGMLRIEGSGILRIGDLRLWIGDLRLEIWDLRLEIGDLGPAGVRFEDD